MKGVIKKIAGVLLIVVVAVFAAIVVGCGDDNDNEIEYDAKNTYAIFKDSKNNETRISANSSASVEYDYGECYKHYFSYSVYYGEDDTRIDSGLARELSGYESGTHKISITEAVYDSNGDFLGNVQFDLNVVIHEKGEEVPGKTHPQLSLNIPQSITEDDGNGIKYVYEYDGHSIYYAVILEDENHFIEFSNILILVSVKFNGEWYDKDEIQEIGTYVLHFVIDSDRYLNESDREKYYGVDEYVTVEIREHIEIKYDEIELNTDIEVDVKSHQEEYLIFEPTKSFVYKVEFADKDAEVTVRISNVASGRIVGEGSASGCVNACLTEKNKYCIALYNTNIEVDKKLKLVIREVDSISVGFETDNTLSSAYVYYAFIPEHNGEYTFEYLTKGGDVIVSLNNSDDIELYHNEICNDGSLSYFYEQGETYYLTIMAFDINIELHAEFNFTPPCIHGNSIVVDDTDRGNIVKLAPIISGIYKFTADSPNTNIRIYDTDKQDVTNSVLSSDDVYYIFVSSDMSAVTITFTLSCDKIFHNVPYTVANGNNSVAFVAPFTGRYNIVGLERLNVLDSSQNIIYGIEGFDFEQGEVYYIGFNSCFADNTVKIIFDPNEIYFSDNSSIIIDSEEYFKLEITTVTKITIKAASWSESAVPIKIYDENLNLIVSGENSIDYELLQGKYYIKIEANDDTKVSLTNDAPSVD